MKKDKGYSLLRNPRKNKGTAFTKKERQKYGLEGLLPDGVETLDIQVMRIKNQLDQIEMPIYKYS